MKISPEINGDFELFTSFAGKKHLSEEKNFQDNNDLIVNL